MSNQEKKVKWLDLSVYQVHLGVFEMPNGERRLVMVDETGKNATLADALGLKEAAVKNIYFKKGEQFSFTGAMRQRYNEFKVIEILPSERDANMKRKMNQVRAASMRASSSGAKPGWKPSSPIYQKVEKEEPISVSTAIGKVVYCGMNASGHQVFEQADGERFIRGEKNEVIGRESNAKGGVEFLRIKDAQDQEGIIDCAKGIIIEMQRTKLHSADFERYIISIFGQDAKDNEYHIVQLQKAIDENINSELRRISESQPLEDVFEGSRRLQEMRPSYFRPDGSFPTPPSVSVVMQAIVSAHTQDKSGDLKLLDVDSSGSGQHSWMINLDEKIATPPSSGLEPHNYCIGGIYGAAISSRSYGQVSVDRADHDGIVRSLQVRSDDGLSIFTICADEKPGDVSPASRRLISWLGANYEIPGIVDLDPSMIGEGVKDGSRIIVVGNKKAELDDVFAAPSHVNVIFDHDELFEWGRSVIGNDFREVESFGDVRRANWLQSPYIPHSQVSEPARMSPRNLLGPARRALTKIVNDNDASIDEFVCNKMGWKATDLEDGRLDAEQIDAIALGIRAIDSGTGFIVGDQTGIGKGRILACLAAYSISQGKKTVFMTKDADVYADFFRDIEHVGLTDVIGKPFLLNTNGGVRSMDGESVLFEPSSHDEVLSLAKNGQWPDAKLVMASYTLFNRETATQHDLETDHEINDAIAAIKQERSFEEIPNLRNLMDIGLLKRKLLDENGQPLDDASFLQEITKIASYDVENTPVYARKHSLEDVAQAKRELRLRAMKPRELIKEIKAKYPVPLNAWRAFWATQTNALDDAVVIMDESHKAANVNSNTSINVRNIARKVAACIYSSATAVKDESNLPLYSRVFPDYINSDEIPELVATGGMALREILTAMLAEDGLYIRREHDISTINVNPVKNEAHYAQNVIYKDSLSEILMEMSDLAAEIKEIVKQKNDSIKGSLKKADIITTHSYSGPFSKFYTLSRAFNMALNAEYCADLAIETIRKNEKPVLVVENTMEMALNDLVELEGGERDANGTIKMGRNVDFRDILHRYARNMFNVYEVKRHGRKIVSKKLVANVLPGKESRIQKIHSMINSLPDNLPLSPVDAIREKVQKAGYSVDEFTGRKIQLSTDEDGNQFVEQIEPKKSGVGMKIIHDFNAGDLDLVILSKTASAGISLHASETFADTRTRTMIEVQPASDVVDRVQLMGRTNRNGQVCPPKYLMPMTGLSHELRLAMIQNTASRSLSASTSGNSENLMVNREVPDIMNDIGNQVCYEWLSNRPDVARLMGLVLDEEEDGAGIKALEKDDAAQKSKLTGTKFVDKLTGRLFMLPSGEEKAAWEELFAEYSVIIDEMKKNGFNPLETTRKDVRAKVVNRTIIEKPYNANNNSTFSKPAEAVEIEYTRMINALSAEEINGIIKASAEESKAAFNKNPVLAGHANTIDERLNDLFRKKVKQAADEAGLSVAEYKLVHTGKWNKHHARYGTICSALNVKQGNTFRLNNGESRNIQGIFLACIPPTEVSHTLNPAMWRIRYFNVKEKRVDDLRLKAHDELVVWGRGNKIDEEDLRSLTTSEKVVERRLMLQGNLFLAAKIVNRIKKGEAVSYTNDKGVWQQAFMLPSGIHMEDTLELDAVVSTPTMALDLFEAEKEGADEFYKLVMANSFSAKERIYAVRMDGEVDELVLDSPRPSREDFLYKRSLITRDEVLKSLSKEGKFTGMKGTRTVRFSKENIVPALERIIELGRQINQPPLVLARWRRLLDLHAEKKAAMLEQIKRAPDPLSAMGL